MNPEPQHLDADHPDLTDRVQYSRAENRLACPWAAFATLDGAPADDPQSVILLANISRHGLAIYATRPHEVGSFLRVCLSPLAGTRPSLWCRVMHCTEQPIGDWFVGCQIVDRPLTPDELQACLTHGLTDDANS